MRVRQTGRQEHPVTHFPQPGALVVMITLFLPVGSRRPRSRCGRPVSTLLFSLPIILNRPVATQPIHDTLLSLLLPNIGSISLDRFTRRDPFWNMDDACIQLILERKSAWPAHH